MYTVIEAAEALKLDPSHVRYLIRSGKLKGVKWGRDWMIPALDYRRKRGCKENTSQASKENLYKHAASNKTDIFQLFLKETPIFEGVNPHELMILAESSSRLHFDKYQTIVMEEDKAEFFYIILSGLVKISMISPSGRELIIDILDRGKVFGIGSLISGYVYPDEVHAMENADIVSIPKIAFVAFTSRNPEVMTKIVEWGIAQIIALLAKLTDLATNKTNYRVIKIINELGSKFGDILPFTHKEIAEMSGTTSETATRVLVSLKEQGALKLQRGNIQITDAKRLLL